MHLDYHNPEAQKLLVEKSGLEQVISVFLAEEDSRPRCTSFREGLLLSLRGVNLNPGSDPEYMVGLRLWFENNRIISTCHRRVLSVVDIQAAIEDSRGPKSMEDFLVQITGHLMERMRQVIDDLEDHVLTAESHQLRSQIASLRRQAISLRRYLSPQREALSRLLTEKISWLDESARIELREISDRLSRYIEDLAEARDRAAVTQE